MIQDARNVVHGGRAFGPIDDAQEQVVILGALVAGPEPPISSRTARRITVRWQVYMHDRK